MGAYLPQPRTPMPNTGMSGSQSDTNFSNVDIGDTDSPGGPGFYESPEQELLRHFLDTSDLLLEFEHRVLRGQVQTANKQTGQLSWTNIGNKTIINEEGIREVMGRLISRVSKIGRLTYKTEEEIYKDMFYFDMSVTELIAKRSQAWGLDIEVAKSLKDSCVELVWDVVAGSRNGFTAINLRSQYTRSEVTSSQTTSTGAKGKTFLGIPLGGAKNP